MGRLTEKLFTFKSGNYGGKQQADLERVMKFSQLANWSAHYLVHGQERKSIYHLYKNVNNIHQKKNFWPFFPGL